jgi:hypothetical protein
LFNYRSGKIWAVFETPDDSKKAHDALNNRFFRSRRIYLSYASERCFEIMFK